MASFRRGFILLPFFVLLFCDRFDNPYDPSSSNYVSDSTLVRYVTHTIIDTTIVADTVIHVDTVFYIDSSTHIDTSFYIDTLFDTVAVYDSIGYIDTLIYYDTVTTLDSLLDTVTVYDSVGYIDTLHVFDTIIHIDTTFDTVTVQDTIFHIDTLVFADTTFDTLVVYDTLTILDTLFDTVAVFDTTYDTITVPDTVWTFDTVTVYDTTHITVYDTVIVYDTLYDTLFDTIAVYDTTLIDDSLPSIHNFTVSSPPFNRVFSDSSSYLCTLYTDDPGFNDNGESGVVYLTMSWSFNNCSECFVHGYHTKIWSSGGIVYNDALWWDNDNVGTSCEYEVEQLFPGVVTYYIRFRDATQDIWSNFFKIKFVILEGPAP